MHYNESAIHHEDSRGLARLTVRQPADIGKVAMPGAMKGHT
jgi:hypothetical protein